MRDEKYITKIVAASLLGDASIEHDKRDNGNSNFTISLIQDHRDHLEYIEQVLAPITACSWYEKNGGFASSKKQWRLRSKRHPFFNKFRERMYATGRKSVDPHYLTLLDAEFLAVWYMQDGNYCTYVNQRGYLHQQIRLATHSFSYAENMFLRAKLKEVLDLDFNVHTSRTNNNIQYYLRCATKSNISKFIEIVTPYIQPSFQYKVISRMKSPVNSGEDMI